MCVYVCVCIASLRFASCVGHDVVVRVCEFVHVCVCMCIASLHFASYVGRNVVVRVCVCACVLPVYVLQAVLAVMWLCVNACLCMCIASLPNASCVGRDVVVRVCVFVHVYCQSTYCKLCWLPCGCVCTCLCILPVYVLQAALPRYGCVCVCLCVSST